MWRHLTNKKQVRQFSTNMPSQFNICVQYAMNMYITVGSRLVGYLRETICRACLIGPKIDVCEFENMNFVDCYLFVYLLTRKITTGVD